MRILIRRILLLCLLLAAQESVLAQVLVVPSEKSGKDSASFYGSCEEFVEEVQKESEQNRWGNVAHLQLDGGPFTDQLGPALKSFCNLETLWLGFYPDGVSLEPGAVRCLQGRTLLKELVIHGEGAERGEISSLRKCTSLEVLDIGGGIILDRSDFAGLGKLEGLETLSIDCNQIESLDWVRHLKRLKELRLSANRLEEGLPSKEGLPSIVRSLPSLTTISIDFVTFNRADLEELAATPFANMEHLGIGVDRSSSLSLLQDFSNLRSLDISVEVDDGFDFEFLRGMTSLRIVYLRGMEEVPDTSFEFSSLPNLLGIEIRDSGGVCLYRWSASAQGKPRD